MGRELFAPHATRHRRSNNSAANGFGHNMASSAYSLAMALPQAPAGGAQRIRDPSLNTTSLPLERMLPQATAQPGRPLAAAAAATNGTGTNGTPASASAGPNATAVLLGVPLDGVAVRNQSSSEYLPSLAALVLDHYGGVRVGLGRPHAWALSCPA